MDEGELMRLMKRRILESYRWQEDVIKPLSRELEIDVEEFQDILMEKLDMSSLEALHPRFESARPRCIRDRLHSDLQLCWLVDVMEIISVDDAEALKDEITEMVLGGREYSEALTEGRRRLHEILRS
jgi:energy-converting hydrogenase A subunit M